MDLLDHYRGTLSARRLRVLVQHLPADSNLVRALHGEQADWRLADHLLATVVDQLAVANWLFVSANSGDGDRPEPPAPLPRPGIEESAATRASTPEEIAAFFGGL
ncbi:hypothetical protein [Kutzneria sp. CA-103260]|uniref:hypothetical protein n=1 Tax=Kutzneria sp. CA-103260 TaxID=2802641 RepID=UPI001BA9FA6C|nr:hypothetical protein [Kutzneria sp. CA-103260]QUQ62690.1 hypothetical protein JJ691_04020 [Kutzneria sp. CA-103260]